MDQTQLPMDATLRALSGVGPSYNPSWNTTAVNSSLGPSYNPSWNTATVGAPQAAPQVMPPVATAFQSTPPINWRPRLQPATSGSGSSFNPGLNAVMAAAPQTQLPAFMPNQPWPTAALQPSSQATQAPVVPPMPAHLPAGSMYSPSRNMWKSPDGTLYNHAGAPLNPPPMPQSQ